MKTQAAHSFLTALFITALLTATFLSSKFIDVLGIDFSLGLLVFPFTFLSNELMAEVYGRKASRTLVNLGMVVQVFALVFIGLSFVLPTSDLRGTDEAFSKIFGLAPRMILASLTAYWLSQLVDIEAFLTLKSQWKGRYLGLRANLASFMSQALDTAIFMLIFLGGILPWNDWWINVATAFGVKIVVAAIQTPILYWGKKQMEKLDPTISHSNVQAVAVKTPVVHLGDDLVSVILKSVPSALIHEGMVLAITSKVVSMSEKTIVRRADVSDKRELIENEADQFLSETVHGVALTVKHGILIASAGIDESNSENNDFILFPKDPYVSAQRLHQALRKTWKLEKLGILITDSHTTALRRGVTGIALSHWGFQATHSQIGEQDLFGRTMRMTHTNVIDALATAAVYVMGETRECCPLAVVSTPDLRFTETTSAKEIQIPLDEDLYGVLMTRSKKTSAIEITATGDIN